MRRRAFLSAPALAAFQPAASASEVSDTRVYAYGDGIPHTPLEYGRLLARIAESKPIEPDDYSRGGIVEDLESRFAALLGKETAVWLPTGTLANHLAVRLLAGERRRVLVQAESHLYRDSGDCAQTLSGLHLIPLGPASAGFTLAEVERAAADSAMQRVATPVGAVQIETPVRRRRGERFDFDELKKISAWARERRVGVHLDGARLLIEWIYSGRPVKEYASLADTVYVSLYKYFNATHGAVLAGPKVLLENLYHTRRMFGGGVPKSWPCAAVALFYLKDWEQTFRAAKETSEAVIAALTSDTNFAVERVKNGTNIFRLRPVNVNPPVYQLRLEEAGISAPAPIGGWLTLSVNATWNRVPAVQIVSRFRTALG